MKWLQVFRCNLPQHKYAINVELLGDHAEYAWSNLGFWQGARESYPQACQQLADQLAQAVGLTSSDQLLDLGCGQGASLKHWLEHYQIEDLSAVELQPECVHKIRQQFAQQLTIYCQSFLNLKELSFSQKKDVVLCIDAAYHSPLDLFLDSVSAVLNSTGRLGFHYLMLSEQWQNLTQLQRKKYHYLLKAADVNLVNLAQQQDYIRILKQHHFEQIEIIDISQPVLYGFSNYAESLVPQTQTDWLALLKIRMTAKLCAKLYQDGLVRYVQISAVKQ